MPLLPLVLVLQAALPWLSARGRAVIVAMGNLAPRTPGADRLARLVGLRSRFQLVRLLQREGLPPAGQLVDWTCVLRLLLESEATGEPLLRIARRVKIEPATCYRRCQRTLGVPWSQARASGFAWALFKFTNRCRRPRPWHPLIRESRMMSGPSLPRIGGPIRASSPRGHPRGARRNTIPLDGRPYDVAVSPQGVVLVIRADLACVERLDPTRRRGIASISVGSNPTHLTFDSAGRRAFVSNQYSDSISIIDVARNRQIDEIPVNGAPVPVVVSPDDRTLYTTTHADELYAIALATKRVVGRLPLPAASHHLTWHPSRSVLYVATRAAGTVLEVDARTLRVLRTFALGGQTQALAVAADGSELYVANEAGGLEVVDLLRGTHRKSMALDGGAYGLALTPDNAQLYVGMVTRGRVDVVDRETLQIVRTIRTGGVPREITFFPSGAAALIANESGWIDVVI